MTKHAVGWGPGSPSPDQLSEFFQQIGAGLIDKVGLQAYLNKPKRLKLVAEAELGDLISDPLDHLRNANIGGHRIYRLTPDFVNHIGGKSHDDNYSAPTAMAWEVKGKSFLDSQIAVELGSHIVTVSLPMLVTMLELQWDGKHEEGESPLLNTDGGRNVCYLQFEDVLPTVVSYRFVGGYWEIERRAFDSIPLSPGTRIITPYIKSELSISEKDMLVGMRLDLDGKMTIGDGSPVFRNRIRDLLKRGKNKIALDLYDVDYIDSSGIGELVGAFHAVKEAKGKLIFLCLKEGRAKRKLTETKLITAFEIADTEEEAVQLLS